MKIRYVLISAVILIISVVAFILSFNNPDPYNYMTVHKATGNIMILAYTVHNIILTEYIAGKKGIEKKDITLKIILSVIIIVTTITIITVGIALMCLFDDDKMGGVVGMTILCYAALPEVIILTILSLVFSSIYQKHKQEKSESQNSI